MPAPEILAPAGNAEMLRAAVFAGADAVYLGLDGYNARRSAGNFTPQALREAVCFCHARGVAVHVPLNTLVYGDELEGLLDLEPCKLGCVQCDRNLVDGDLTGTLFHDCPCNCCFPFSACVDAIHWNHLTFEPRNFEIAPRVVYLPVTFFIAKSTFSLSTSSNCFGVPTNT